MKGRIHKKTGYLERKEMRNRIKNDDMANYMKEKYGIEVVDEKNSIISRDFFEDIIEELGRNKEERLKKEGKNKNNK